MDAHKDSSIIGELMEITNEIIGRQGLISDPFVRKQDLELASRLLALAIRIRRGTEAPPQPESL